MHTTTELARQVMFLGPTAERVNHAALYERVMRRIYRYFCRLLESSEDAADCLQRTILLLEESLRSGKYDPDRSFNTWLWLKARTVFAQWCRAHEREPNRAEGFPELGTTDPDLKNADRRHDADKLLRLVAARLGPEAFETFTLYYESGLSLVDVAELIGCTRKTVRRRIDASHQAIERFLASDGAAPLSEDE